MYSLGKSITEDDGKLISGFFPGSIRHAPVLDDIAKGPVQQFGGGLITGKVASVFHDLSQPHMQTFDGVSGVDNL